MSKTIEVINLENQVVSKVDIPEEFRDESYDHHLILDYIRWQRANSRSAIASTKGRSDVKCSTKKIYRQKGTGGARHGARSAPIFRGGGVVFGPSAERNYSLKMNKKVRRKALSAAMSYKNSQGSLKVIDNLNLDAISTANLNKKLSAITGNTKSVIVDVDFNENFILSSRNLYKHKTLQVQGVNVYDIMKYEYLIISVEALKNLKERING